MTVTDTVVGAVCGSFGLAVGDERTCTATHITTGGDVAREYITNVATATGTSPDDKEVYNTARTTVSYDNSPAIAISKTASRSAFSAAGQFMIYTYTVVNTGASALEDVQVTDTLPRLSPIDCTGPGQGGSFPIGEQMTCTASYVITPQDVAEVLTRRAITVIAGAIVLMAFAFSLGNVTRLCLDRASRRGLPGWSAPGCCARSTPSALLSHPNNRNPLAHVDDLGAAAAQRAVAAIQQGAGKPGCRAGAFAGRRQPGRSAERTRRGGITFEAGIQ